MGQQELASSEGLQDGPLMNGDVLSDTRSEGAASALPPSPGNKRFPASAPTPQCLLPRSPALHVEHT